MIIRPLTINDYDSYFSLLKQLTNYNYSCSKDDFQKKLSSIFVLEYNNQLLATAKLLIEEKFGHNVAHIEDVVTDINHRGKGYGKQLILFLCNEAKKFNVYKIILQTSIPSFYEKCGFKVEGVNMTMRF